MSVSRTYHLISRNNLLDLFYYSEDKLQISSFQNNLEYFGNKSRLLPVLVIELTRMPLRYHVDRLTPPAAILNLITI